jgi:tRNA pseudouridine38-40 synthase
VQGVLEDALARLRGGTRVELTVAGRTDRGVHALAQALHGTHDFTAFTPTETDHTHFARDVLSARWTAVGEDQLEFWVTADAFMRHMNRVLVGTMLEVAGGRRSIGSFAALLAGAPRAEAGPTAPPHGLYFAGVGYNAAPRPR